jgi:hypothetical protein
MGDQLPDGVTLGPIKSDGPAAPSVLQSQSAPPPVAPAAAVTKPVVQRPASGLPPGVTLGPMVQPSTTSASASTSDPTKSDNWTNWSPDQPLSSYAAATRGAIGGLVSDTLSAVKGAVKSLNPLPQNDDEQMALGVGGPGGMYVHRILTGLSPIGHAVMNPHEIAEAIHTINQSKDPTGTYLQIAQKTASQGAGAALTALATEGVVKAVPAIADAVTAAPAAEATEAATPVQAALNKTAVKSGLPEGNYPVTQADIANATKGLGEGPMIDTTIRGTMDDVASDHGLGPDTSQAPAGGEDAPPTTSIRDVVKNTGDQVMAKSKAAYAQLDDASGGRWQRFDDQISNLSDKMDEVNGIDDDKYADLEAKKNDIETSQTQMVEDLKAEGKITPELADQALGDYKQAQSLYDLDKAVKASTTGRMGMGSGAEVVDSGKLTNRLNKLYDTGRLQQAVGADRATNLLSTSQNVVDTVANVKNLPPISATGQQALKELMQPATSQRAMLPGVKQDFVQGFKNFNKLTAEEQLAKFPGPGEAAKAGQFLRNQARIQIGTKIAGGLTLGAIAHEAGLDKYVFHALID